MRAVWLLGILTGLGEALASPAGRSMTPARPWLEVSERTTCEAMQDEHCLGRYGFTIRRDGTFVAGGAGGDRTTEGRVASQALKQLSALIEKTSQGALEAQRACKNEGVPGINDQIDLTIAGGAVVRIYDLGGQVGKVCFVGSWDRVHQLHEFLRRQMTRYYPAPFPRN